MPVQPRTEVSYLHFLSWMYTDPPWDKLGARLWLEALSLELVFRDLEVRLDG